MIETNISTNENLVQDNSSTECVSPETNPTPTVQNNELIFGQKHNGIECALCPTAKRACDRAWVTAKQIENWSGMSTKTLWRRLNELEEVGRICSLSNLTNVDIPTETGAVKQIENWSGMSTMTLWRRINELEECERISRLSDLINVDIPTETGAVKTTLYNLNVLNQLAMVCACFPNGRATYWTKCMTKTMSSLESTEKSEKSRRKTDHGINSYRTRFHGLCQI